MSATAPRRLLFVCTGNTCRSPMAEHLFLRLAREAGLPWTASSAGTAAAAGMPLSRGAAAVFAARGIGPVAHRARRVDAALLREADAVYTLERAHRDELAARFPEAAAKLFVLREAAGLTPADVDDPVGADAALYEATAASIEEALKTLVERHRHASNPR
ncbi:MAG: low molecular weight protein arginine phosphatase [Elusimicrobiota bacterium]|nr:low molecular weight protein arginine phosphatase [Elusimicrobiota bacterium]